MEIGVETKRPFTPKCIVKEDISDLFNISYKNPEMYPDQLAIEYYNAREELESLETFQVITDFNIKSKLKMLNKINNIYGSCNRGIENYCRIQSLEAEENSTNDQQTTSDSQDSTNNNDNDNTENKNKLQKTMDFLKKIHESIVNVFNKLIEWILNLINKFRYSNKVLENTINAINNANAEELNKLSGDLKSVEFESKGILEISKHPTENLNKRLGLFDTIGSVYQNAISSANSNVKDFTRIKDFSVKLYEFMNIIPEVGKSCPKYENDGNASLKQYYDSLKTYCSSSMNYNKNMSPFNKFLANSETLNGKMTVIKIIGSVDPKSIINTIKLENEAVGKINDVLKKNKENFDKSFKDIATLFKKFATVSDKLEANAINDQIQTLIVMEKVMVQLNSIFSGICSNIIKSVNLVKGKLIDFTKKNIGNKTENNNKKEEKPKK